MGIKKLIVNTAVRELLLELDHIMDEYHAISAELARVGMSYGDAVNLAADKESLKNRIVGVAYRLNEACIASAKGCK